MVDVEVSAHGCTWHTRKISALTFTTLVSLDGLESTSSSTTALVSCFHPQTMLPPSELVNLEEKRTPGGTSTERHCWSTSVATWCQTHTHSKNEQNCLKVRVYSWGVNSPCFWISMVMGHRQLLGSMVGSCRWRISLRSTMTLEAAGRGWWWLTTIGGAWWWLVVIVIHGEWWVMMANIIHFSHDYQPWTHHGFPQPFTINDIV